MALSPPQSLGSEHLWELGDVHTLNRGPAPAESYALSLLSSSKTILCERGKTPHSREKGEPTRCLTPKKKGFRRQSKKTDILTL